jgi:hypothetical protein
MRSLRYKAEVDSPQERLPSKKKGGRVMSKEALEFIGEHYLQVLAFLAVVIAMLVLGASVLISDWRDE